MTHKIKLSIIIPVYNEEKYIKMVLQAVCENNSIFNISKEIIIINDFSTDNSEQIIQKFCIDNKHYDIKYFCHSKNLGKGAAIRAGIGHASGDYIIIQDADLEYDPDEYDLLLKPVFKADADVVYGSRFMGSKPHRILFFWHSIGNKLLTFLSNIFTNLNLTDMETCYKLFRSSFIKSVELKENRFGFEPEVTAKLSKVPNIKFYEVGISYYGRTYAEGKKINWKDGIRALVCIIKYSTFLNRGN